MLYIDTEQILHFCFAVKISCLKIIKQPFSEVLNSQNQAVNVSCWLNVTVLCTFLSNYFVFLNNNY